MRRMWAVFRTRSGGFVGYRVTNKREIAYAHSLAKSRRMTGGTIKHSLPENVVPVPLIVWDGVEDWREFARRMLGCGLSRNAVARAVRKASMTVKRLVEPETVRAQSRAAYARRDRDWHAARKLAAYRRAERKQA